MLLNQSIMKKLILPILAIFIATTAFMPTTAPPEMAFKKGGNGSVLEFIMAFLTLAMLPCRLAKLN
ncbi:ATP-dependent exoDNAse (exonuclease V) alpha subunit [Nonlabens ulvanivorans]|uniref:ATP-dependent exoDNAse (Exonuclease V) alpha subunit n=1 Tax=Nonlabens ulvanivorans TaxID=906888 RepID=A0A090Q9X4_NONUL|nr:ATP-dependent exoDNAse (exonuclease V) alpha subunit [Nonlabens ulvanivorans]